MRRAHAFVALTAVMIACTARSTTVGELFPIALGGAADDGGAAPSDAGAPAGGSDVTSGGSLAAGGQATSGGSLAQAGSSGMTQAGGTSVGEAGAADGGAGGAPTLPCTPPPYPTGPYGVIQGATVAPTRSFSVYRAGQSTLSTVTMADYFEAAHCGGVRALYVVELEAADPTSETATTEIQQNLAGPWQGRGVEVLELVTRGASGQNATSADALAWQQAHAASWSVGADPAEAFHDASGYYSQIRVVIDACSMKVLRWVHRDDVAPDLTKLASSAGCGP